MPLNPQPLDSPSTSQGTTGRSSYFSYPVRYAVTSAFRRMSSNTSITGSKSQSQSQSRSTSRSRDVTSEYSDSSNAYLASAPRADTQRRSNSAQPPKATRYQNIMDMDMSDDEMGDFVSGDSDYEPIPSPYTRGGTHLPTLSTSTPASSTITPRRTPSPFNPPPLSPLSLDTSSLVESSQILSRLLAEEIRLLLPARLQLVDRWRVLFSLGKDGSSLSTLFEKCEELRGERGGFVVVVKDGARSIFGAYLSDLPAPSRGHYYGNGECFLWRSTILSSTLPTMSNFSHPSSNIFNQSPSPDGFESFSPSELASMNLPPPPSADTTHATRMTTVGSPTFPTLHTNGNGMGPAHIGGGWSQGNSGTDTPDRIRFKAFPYSGVNDYMIFCEHGFLSVGGGDGHYGLWLDSSLERGISSSCPTFGNEPLSEEGEKFDVLGVEVWFIGV